MVKRTSINKVSFSSEGVYDRGSPEKLKPFFFDYFRHLLIPNTKFNQQLCDDIIFLLDLPARSRFGEGR